MVHSVALILSFLLLPVYASIQQRKHSTAHSFPNGAVLILGGIDLNATLCPSLTLHFNKKDLSLRSLSHPSFTFLNYGHTSHSYSDAVFSAFGALQTSPIKSITAKPSITDLHINNNSSSLLAVTPSLRYMHTSVLINDTLHIIGGKDTTTHTLINTTLTTSILTNNATWTRQSHPPMSGHVSIVYHQWIISCFGHQSTKKISSDCTWFDTTTLKSTGINSTRVIGEWPTARIHASMMTLDNHDYILFGGQDNTTILSDLWLLHVEGAFSMKWSKINTLTQYKRSAHAGALIDKELILYYGGHDSLTTLATDPIYFSLTNKEWIHDNSFHGDIHRLDVDNNSITNAPSIRGGTIAGIIVGIASVIALCLVYFVWRKRSMRKQHKMNNSRVARFSQHHPHHQQQQQQQQSEKVQVDDYLQGEGKEGSHPTATHTDGFLSLPELALHTSRMSAVSLGTEFRFSADDYHHRRTSNNPSERTPSIEHHPLSVLQEEGQPVNYKRRESTGLNRLALTLFSSTTNNTATHTPLQQPTQKKDKRSSYPFQFKSLQHLHPPSTPTTPTVTDARYPQQQSRISLGAKSVSSVQWVGFNDSMDYKMAGGWRDSAGSSLHLAVTNAHQQRSSMYYSDSSAQSTPKSPMFPHYLKDSTIQRHMFGGLDSTISAGSSGSHSSRRRSEVVDV